MSNADIRAVRWLQLSHLIIDCYPGFIAPMLPFITAKIGVEMSAAMIIISVANISSYCYSLFSAILPTNAEKDFSSFGELSSRPYLSR